MKKIASLATLTLIPFVTFLGGCGPGDDGNIYTGSVTTIAGMASVSGVANGSGTLARFNFPIGISTYGTNLYVADSGNEIIRKVDISASGIPVTTLAGTGSSGSADGPGATASFRDPSGIVADIFDVYVADTLNHTIRQIDISASGVPVTTLAGTATVPGTTDGTGGAAKFKAPIGIVRNGTDLYIADTNSHTIRKIDTTSAVVTTIAGTAGISGSLDHSVGTSALFNSPSGLTTDGLSLYVADTGNHTIRQIDISVSGIPPVTTIAGNTGMPAPGSADGTDSGARFSFPMGIVRDGASLYVADSGNHTIRQIVIATHMVTTLAGAAGSSGTADGTKSAARFNSPQGITTDGTSLYVTDTGNHTIRKIQ